MEQDILSERKEKVKNKLFSWVKDNYDVAFIVVLIAAFIIRFLVFLKTQDQAIWWDAADYLETAKRWAGINPNFMDVWYYRRGFFWPLFEAIFFKLSLGEIGIRLAVVLISTGIVAVSYFLIKEMFNKKLALFVSLCTVFSWIYLFFSGRLLTSLPATFFLLLAILFFWKGYVNKKGNKFIYLFGLFFALACLTRMQYLMFALPFLVLVFTKEKFSFLKNKHLWVAVGIFFLIFIPQFVMHYQHFGNPIADLATYYLGIQGSELGEVGVKLTSVSNLFVYFKNLPYILDGNEKGYNTFFALSPIYCLFIIGFFYFFADLFLGLDKIFKNPYVQKKFFILIWIISTFMFLGYIAPHLEQRYMMQTLPFLFLIAIYPLQIVEKFILNKFKIKKIYIFFLILVILVLMLLPNFSFGNKLIESKKTSYLEVKQAGEWIKENSNPDDIIISTSLPQTTYYSERPTYPYTLAIRRELASEAVNETGFNEFVKSDRPKYMIISIFESHYDWVYAYPEKYPNLVTPVKAFYQGEQPVLIIYEFQYA